MWLCVWQNETGATDNDDYDSEDERERKLLNLQVLDFFLTWN